MAKTLYTPLRGDRFERMVVISDVFRFGRLRRVTCQCDCGVRKDVTVCKLYAGETRSCGCAKIDRARSLGSQNRRHGHSIDGRTPTYLTWQSMILRCENPKTNSYHRYGGRGISVCQRWRGHGGFQNFLTDMGERPNGRTLDRVDPDGNYTPDNCRWADNATQAKNKSKIGG